MDSVSPAMQITNDCLGTQPNRLFIIVPIASKWEHHVPFALFLSAKYGGSSLHESRLSVSTPSADRMRQKNHIVKPLHAKPAESSDKFLDEFTPLIAHKFSPNFASSTEL